MKNLVYYLPSCSTCQAILKSLSNTDKLKHVDIKANGLSEADVEKMYALSKSYEALFSKRAMLYKSLDLKSKNLQEPDYKKYLLEHYTFLSRPVFIINGKIFISNNKKVVEEVAEAMAQLE
jgi:arsenate reductase (glutaredoxin)